MKVAEKRALCEAHQAMNTHWERTMESLTTFIANKQPSLNQRFAMVRNHRAAQAQATSSSWVQHHESSQIDYPDLEEQSYDESAIDQATLNYQTYGDVPLQAAAAREDATSPIFDTLGESIPSSYRE